MFMRLLCVCLVVASSTVSAEWEVSVCLGDRLESLDGGGRTVNTRPLGLVSPLSADILALDSVSGRLFLADSHNSNASIFSVNLRPTADHLPPTPVVPKSSRVIGGVAYDMVNRTVYWTTGPQGTILRSTLSSDGSQSTIQVIHSFTSEVPHGIAVDSCRRKLLWSNCNITSPSIESSDLEGSDRHVLVQRGLFQPLGLALSQGDGWLYWADEGAGYSFTIERIRLDGTGREKLVDSRHQQPVALAVVPGEYVYWTDQLRQAVWRLDLQAIERRNRRLPVPSTAVQPVLVKEYKRCTPSGLVAIRQDSNLDTQTCSDLIKLIHQGESSWKSGGRICPSDYCLHNGTCMSTAHDGLSCTCNNGYLGDRCQYETRLCSTYCLDTSSLTDNYLRSACQCSGVSAVISTVETGVSWTNVDWRLATLVLGGVCCVLVVLSVVCSVRSYRLSKRPKLRRRYTVSKSGRSSKDGGRGEADARSQCEIGDIENCCNMNICETPCYEPEFRTPGRYSGKSQQSNKVEKRSLIADMEVPEPTGP